MAAKNSYADRIARGSALIFVSTFASMFVAYLLRLFLTRTLTVEEYGLLYAVIAFVNFFTLFRDLGFNQALVKFFAEWGTKEAGKIYKALRWVLKLQLWIAAIASIVLFVSATIIANAYFHTPNATSLVEIFAIVFFAAHFVNVWMASLQGMQRIKAFATVQFSNNFLPLVFTVVLVFVGLGILGAASAYLATAIVLGVLGAMLVNKSIPRTDATFGGADKKCMTKFAFPVLLGMIGGIVLGYMDTMVLTYFRPLAEVGVYQAALPTSQILWAIAGALAIVLFPMVSEMWRNGDKRTLSCGISLVLRFSFMLVLPLALIMLAWPELILSLLFGGAYVTGAAALQILAVAALAYTLWQICSVVLSGVGRPDITTKIVLGVAAVNLVGNVILVQSFGMVGISVMTLISFLLAFLASFAFTRKLTSTALGWTALLKSVAAGLSMLLVIFGIKTLLLPIDVWLTIVVSLIVGLVAYFAVLLRLRAISESELELLAGLAVPIPKTVFGAAKMLLGSK